jgi:hypothetical protein
VVRRKGAGSRLCSLLSMGLGVTSMSVDAKAGAWTLDAGAAQGSVVGTASSSDRVFDADSNVRSARRYSKIELTGLLEYGATNWLTLVLSPQLQHIDIGPPIDARRDGIGYTDLGGRAKVYEWSSWVFSVQTTLRAAGTSAEGNPAAIGYTDTQVDVRGLIGRSFSVGTWPAFIDMQVAQRFRWGRAPDEFRADFTFGVQPDPSWQILAQSFNVVSEGAGAQGFSSYNYFKFQLSAVYRLTPKLALQLGGFTTYAGHNALQENGALLGAWFKF